MVFASLYPVDTGDFNSLVTAGRWHCQSASASCGHARILDSATLPIIASAVDRLTLNDASVSVEKESSSALGLGLRCGFLGLLHMDVFNQRLATEFSTPVITTAPMVRYKLRLVSGSSGNGAAGRGSASAASAAEFLSDEEADADDDAAAAAGLVTVERPCDFPPPHTVAHYYEPTARVTITAPERFLSPLMSLLAERRGVQEEVLFLATGAATASLAPPGVLTSNISSGADEVINAAASGHAEIANNDDGSHDDIDSEVDADDDDGEIVSAAPIAPAREPVESNGSVKQQQRVLLRYRVPWAEVVTNFYDAVKSLTAGYASVDWLPASYVRADVVKVDVLVNTKAVDALCFVAHKDKAATEGRRVVTRLRSVIARQQFEIIIQAAIAGKVFARERIAPYRKDVLIKSGKLVGGGDRTRKEKLLAKQREGKKRMKTVSMRTERPCCGIDGNYVLHPTYILIFAPTCTGW